MSIRFRAIERGTFMRPEAVIAAAIAAQRKHADDLVTKFQIYPPPKANSKYERTEKLKDGWRINGPRITGNGVITSIFNIMKYFKFVMGPKQQEQHATTGWLIASKNADRQQYRVALQQAINRVIH